MSVYEVVQQEFPSAPSRLSALTAFVIVNSGRPLSDYKGLSDDVIDLVRNYSGQSKVSNLAEQIENVNKTLERLLASDRVLEFAIAYVIYDRLGFRKNNITVGKPEQMPFYESDLVDMITRLKEQAQISRREEGYRTGRPERRSRK